MSFRYPRAHEDDAQRALRARREIVKEEARQLLGEIYDWFTEGLNTKDLQEAKTLLEELTG